MALITEVPKPQAYCVTATTGDGTPKALFDINMYTSKQGVVIKRSDCPSCPLNRVLCTGPIRSLRGSSRARVINPYGGHSQDDLLLIVPKSVITEDAAYYQRVTLRGADTIYRSPLATWAKRQSQCLDR